ncbi:bifunctional riboflavin kinase/FAD synthetase [Bacillus sp. SCS-151]|uniref:bifunctional riboflavin kinase/FAD synthetase n=1 Tax=Nanhaiella sioensis TaxID=3115293 RepID=UPI00397D6604
MKVINISHPHQMKKELIPETVLALGFFDGVHLGHQKVIKTAKEIANQLGMKSAVMTFFPHPSVVLASKEKHVEYITTQAAKEQYIANLGVDMLYVVKFTSEFANLLPQQFVDDYIINLHAKHVVAGFDFTYGKLGKGTMETLPFHSRNQFAQTTVDKLIEGNEKISSTAIRTMIKNGNMKSLPSFLGRNYHVTGIVIDGDKRGRTIGFPTANVKLEENHIYPAVGVYAVRIKVKSTWYQGVCNVGFKPTFNKKEDLKPSVEVHIFHFDEMIYGEQVVIEWHDRIRNEQKFSSIEDLVQQIEVDKQEAIKYFEKNKEQTCFLS